MELKDLTAVGMTEEQADKALKLFEGELTAERKKAEDAKIQLDAANASIKDLTEKVSAFDGVDIEGLKKSAKDWEEKYQTDISALKLDSAIDLALAGSKARDTGIVKSLLDTDKLKLDENGKLTGFDEQLEKLTKEKDFLFALDEASGARIDTGLDHGSATDSISDAQVRAVMGLPITKEVNNA